MQADNESQGADLLAMLRSRTSQQHRRLDDGISLIHAGAIQTSRYVAFLQASARVIQVLEPAVERLVPLEGPTRRAALEADLSALGADALEPAPLSPPESLPAAYGTAYVLEGSTLGGVVLARAVEASLGSGATRYLRLRGERTGAAWSAFLARLRDFDGGATPAQREEAVAAASATFEAYSGSFESAGLLART